MLLRTVSNQAILYGLNLSFPDPVRDTSDGVGKQPWLLTCTTGLPHPKDRSDCTAGLFCTEFPAACGLGLFWWQLYPKEDWVVGSSLPRVFHKDAIARIIDHLSPDNVR